MTQIKAIESLLRQLFDNPFITWLPKASGFYYCHPESGKPVADLPATEIDRLAAKLKPVRSAHSDQPTPSKLLMTDLLKRWLHVYAVRYKPSTGDFSYLPSPTAAKWHTVTPQHLKAANLLFGDMDSANE